MVFNYLAEHLSTSAAILTGIAAHRPCLCSTSPMLKYLDSEVAYFNMGNDQNFTAQLDDLFENESRRKYMVWKGDQYLKKVSPEKIADRYREIYEMVAKG